MKRFKFNDLSWYFLRPHHTLPRAYLASCEKYFKSIKQQAPSTKPQAPSCKLDGWPDLGYSRIIKENKK